MLYILAGLPGAGKTTLARLLAQDLRAVHLRIDTIEHALREAGVAFSGPEGYVVAYRVAADNLRLGLPVVADSVNPIAITRTAWRNVASEAGVPYVEIQVTCSDPTEHRSRIETRHADIPGVTLPTWAEVAGREYEPWDAPPHTIDTARRTPAESLADLRRALQTVRPGPPRQ